MSPRGTKRKAARKEEDKPKAQENVDSASEDGLSAEEAPKNSKRRSTASKKDDDKSKSTDSGEGSDDETVAEKPKTNKKSKPSKTQDDSEDEQDNANDDSDNEGGDENSSVENEGPKDEEENYEVEKIIGDRLFKGKIQYKIRWKGYGPGEDTWENLSDLDCEEILKEYNKRTGRRPSKIKESKKKGPKENGVAKKKPVPNPDPNSEDEYEVERVVDMHTCKNGTREFLVRWKGYTKEDDTWEPESSLEGKQILDRFLQKLDKMKAVDQRALRVNPKHTDIFTAVLPDKGRRVSRRNNNRQRVKYYEAQ